MRKNVHIFYIIVLFNFLFIPYLYAENFENLVADSDIDSILGELDNIYNELNLEKDIDSEIESLKKEKEELDLEVNKLKIDNNKLASETEDVNKIEIIENNKRMKKDIDDLYTKVVEKSNSSESLSNRINELDNDINNERVEMDNSEYETINDEIERENNRIRETGEQIKKRREESKRLKREIIVLDETLESYKIKDGLLGKVVEKYTTHYNSKIKWKPDKKAKLVVLTAKIDCGIDKSSKNWARRENILKRNYKDCLVQYYIPLENLKPRDIKYDFKENCLIINSPRPLLDNEMVYAQTDSDKIEEEYDRSLVSGPGTYKELNTEVWNDLKQTIIESADSKKYDYLKGEAEESAKFHLENFFRGFMKSIKGSSDVKIKINFY